jgi:large subunit ribosomal protein L28
MLPGIKHEGGIFMARRCDICGKGTVSGNTISHAKNALRRVWKPNLIKVKTVVGAKTKTIKVCARCLKSGRVVKVLAGRRKASD